MGRRNRTKELRKADNLFQEGDYIYYKEDENNRRSLYRVFKVLVFDGFAYHVTIYEPVKQEPCKKDVESLKVLIMHVPIGPSIEEKAFVFCHKPVTEDEKEGYYVYLEHMNKKLEAEKTEYSP